MVVEMKSILTGKTSSMELPVTDLQVNLWKSGMLIQEAMPNLSIQQREFLITGMTLGEQDAFFNREEDE
tara:strand:- start:3851 stop:4057 length:207 start_codon:yes stop_codon:yes gene_type:complete